jgi:radical SAM protein with 4Fe4S-binding SPASM domain
MLDIRTIRRYRMNSLIYYSRFQPLLTTFRWNLRRIGNAFRGFLDFFVKRSLVRSRPFVIRLEPSSVCNLKCPGCATPKKVFAPGRVTIMKLESFAKIYAELHEHACRMTFYMSGEPTTNPYLFEMISMASKDKVYTSFSTNFTLMRESWLKRLFDSRLDYISVCLDGFSQEAYEQYRIGGDVSRVKDALRMTMAYKRAGNYDRPFVNVYSITFPQVVAEADKIREFCSEVGVDSLTFRPDESGKDTPHHQLTQRKPLSRCFWPWLTIQVDADGSVYPCPVAFQKYSYGNLNESNLSEIWNNERYVATRKYIAGRRDAGASIRGPLPCETCTMYGDSRLSEKKPVIATEGGLGDCQKAHGGEGTRDSGCFLPLA